METHEKIRMMRELNQWSQEEMARKLNLSTGGYAKIERGETQLSVVRLAQIAKVLNVEIWEIMQDKQLHIICQSHNQDTENTLTVYTAEGASAENEKLKLIIAHKDELLEKSEEIIRRLERENHTLNEMITLLKAQSAPLNQ